jgi:hypothetical protein
MNRFQIKYAYTILLIIAVSIVLSCTKETTCDQSMKSLVKMGFYNLNNQKEVSVSFNDVTVYGINNDSLLYDSSDNVKSISLPLSQVQDSCAFVLCIGSVSDTFKYVYTRDLRIVSAECGFATLFTISNFETTTHKIDSIHIVNPVINTIEAENIKVYY